MEGFDVSGMFERADRERERLQGEFQRLCCEPSSKVPTVGQRVVIAAGFLMRGHLWCREEGTVVEVGETSYKVRYKKSYDAEYSEAWVHPALITDVLDA